MTNKKVLILAHHGIGDVIMKIPLIRFLQKTYGRTNIYITIKSNHIKETISTLANIPSNNIFLYNGGMSGLQKARLLGRLILKRFDTTIIPFNINQSLGKKLSKLIISKSYIAGETGNQSSHKVIQFLSPLVKEGMLQASEIQSICDSLYTIPKIETPVHIEKLNTEKIIIHMGSGLVESHKRFSTKKIAAVIDAITNKQPHIHIALIGAKDEAEINKEITELVTNKDNLIDYTSTLSITELCSLMQHPKSRCMISTDSGPSHLASICKLPVISLFGPTDFELTGPFKYATKVSLDPALDCMPCYGTEEYGITGCGDNKCMYKISEQAICELTFQTLQESRQEKLGS